MFVSLILFVSQWRRFDSPPGALTIEQRTIFSQRNLILPHFTIMIFSVLKKVSVISLKLLGRKKLLKFTDIKEKEFFSVKMKKRRFKIGGKIWSPGEIWFFALDKSF